ANISEPSVPEALADVVSGIHGLHDFEWKSMIGKAELLPYNNNNSAGHALAPDDFATIYNVTPLYGQGIDGTGQNLVIIGQTRINLSDIRTFRTRYNLPANDPQTMLFGPDPGITGDITEADLDVEWSGAVARKANIIYAYARTVTISAQYAV